MTLVSGKTPIGGTTAGGRKWFGAVIRNHRGVRVVCVDVVGCGGYGSDCQWDASPTNKNSRAPTQADMQRMADNAERRFEQDRQTANENIVQRG